MPKEEHIFRAYDRDGNVTYEKIIPADAPGQDTKIRSPVRAADVAGKARSRLQPGS
jgi:hypothetical protein